LRSIENDEYFIFKFPESLNNDIAGCLAWGALSNKGFAVL
jgi:hypothetical protein